MRATLRQGGAGEVGERLTLFRADLNADTGWAEAIAGCDYVLHVASPFPSTAPKDENELIAPARDGALRVLKAARDAGVKRVVLTSSFAAIGYGAPKDRTAGSRRRTGRISTIQGAALCEIEDDRRARGLGFHRARGAAAGTRRGQSGPVLDPCLGRTLSTSILLVSRLMDGSLPGCPDLSFGAVDVRDVADLHMRCMTDPAARGERFLPSAGIS